jgi:hypothetical protein
MPISELITFGGIQRQERKFENPQKQNEGFLPRNQPFKDHHHQQGQFAARSNIQSQNISNRMGANFANRNKLEFEGKLLDLSKPPPPVTNAVCQSRNSFSADKTKTKNNDQEGERFETSNRPGFGENNFRRSFDFQKNVDGGKYTSRSDDRGQNVQKQSDLEDRTRKAFADVNPKTQISGNPPIETPQMCKSSPSKQRCQTDEIESLILISKVDQVEQNFRNKNKSEPTMQIQHEISPKSQSNFKAEKLESNQAVKNLKVKSPVSEFIR